MFILNCVAFLFLLAFPLVLVQMDLYKRDLQENMKTSLSLGILAD